MRLVKNIDKLDGGLVTSYSNANIADSEMRNISNFDYDDRGSLVKRYGLFKEREYNITDLGENTVTNTIVGLDKFSLISELDNQTGLSLEDLLTLVGQNNYNELINEDELNISYDLIRLTDVVDGGTPENTIFVTLNEDVIVNNTLTNLTKGLKLNDSRDSFTQFLFQSTLEQVNSVALDKIVLILIGGDIKYFKIKKVLGTPSGSFVPVTYEPEFADYEGRILFGQEALTLGLNLALNNPIDYLQDNTGVAVFDVSGVTFTDDATKTLNRSLGIFNVASYFKAFVDLPGADTVADYDFRWEFRKPDEDTFNELQDWTNGDSGRQVSFTPTETGIYQILLKVADVGTTTPIIKEFPFNYDVKETNENIPPQSLYNIKQCTQGIVHNKKLLLTDNGGNFIYVSAIDDAFYFPLYAQLEIDTNFGQPITVINKFRKQIIIQSRGDSFGIFGDGDIIPKLNGEFSPYRVIRAKSNIGVLSPKSVAVSEDKYLFLSDTGTYFFDTFNDDEERFTVIKIDNPVDNIVIRDDNTLGAIYDNKYHMFFPKFKYALKWFYQFERELSERKQGIWTKDESDLFNFSIIKNFTRDIILQSNLDYFGNVLPEEDNPEWSFLFDKGTSSIEDDSGDKILNLTSTNGEEIIYLLEQKLEEEGTLKVSAKFNDFGNGSTGAGLKLKVANGSKVAQIIVSENNIFTGGGNSTITNDDNVYHTYEIRYDDVAEDYELYFDDSFVTDILTTSTTTNEYNFGIEDLSDQNTATIDININEINYFYKSPITDRTLEMITDNKVYRYRTTKEWNNIVRNKLDRENVWTDDGEIFESVFLSKSFFFGKENKEFLKKLKLFSFEFQGYDLGNLEYIVTIFSDNIKILDPNQTQFSIELVDEGGVDVPYHVVTVAETPNATTDSTFVLDLSAVLGKSILGFKETLKRFFEFRKSPESFEFQVSIKHKQDTPSIINGYNLDIDRSNIKSRKTKGNLRL